MDLLNSSNVSLLPENFLKLSLLCIGRYASSPHLSVLLALILVSDLTIAVIWVKEREPEKNR